MSIQELISNITPLYNKYKKEKDIIFGTDAVILMWQMGDYLKKYLEEHDVAPHNLYRQIYGKSEGEKNIAQRSYITREAMSRCYRIRNIFDDVDMIKAKLPSLKRYRLFFQAMPFFDNAKYKFEKDEMNNLLELLNSNKSYKEIINEIYKLQKEKIGIKNPRSQRLKDLEKEKDCFINFYNYIHDLILQYEFKQLPDEVKKIDNEFIKIISKNTSAITQDGLKTYEFTIPNNLKEPWACYVALLEKLINQTDAKLIRRFRRIIPPERIARLSEMIYALNSEDSFNYFKN